MTSPDGLTTKQARVYELLEVGLEPTAIAKRLKVTPQAISLHIRNMREKGIQLPATPAAAGSNGSEDLDAMVRDALLRRLDEIDLQRANLDQQADKYRLALEAFT